LALTGTSTDVADSMALLNLYCVAIDGRDLELLDRIVAPDIEISRSAGILRGRDAVLSFYREKFASDPNQQRHVVRDVAVASLSNGADAEFAVTAQFSSAAVTPTGPVIVFMGHYRDLVRRTASGLVLVRKEITFRTTRIDDC
jgi:SnoaL-like domain